jgi:hypothetical protein
MKLNRTLSSLVIAGLATIGLTACDPPMPPDVAAQIAEQYYTCIDGEATVSSDLLLADTVLGWADSLAYSCVDPEPTMTASVLEQTDTSVSAQISSYPATCSPVDTVPLGVDAGVLVYMQSELGALSLSPKSLAGIIDGSITNWNELALDNPGYDIPSLPLTVVRQADSVALKSMLGYLKSLEISVGENLVVDLVDQPNPDLYSALEEGQVAIVPNSYAVYLGLYPASIYLGFDEETQSPVLANPDLAGIQSATTQWKYTETATEVTVTLDRNVTPSAPEGSETADNPYQVIYPVNFYMCSTDQKVTRALARFMLRLDSQGALGSTNYAPLPEQVRIAALVQISKGLPTPTPTQ